MTHYDLVILGTGSGNTIVNDDFEGQRVAIVERGTYGGTCLNRGCIPSKMLVLPADLALDAAHGDRVDLRTGFDGVDWPALRDRVASRTDAVAQAGHQFRHRQAGVDALDGTARFVGERRLQVQLDDGGETEISADQVVIATGGRPIIPDVDGLAEMLGDGVYTSDTIMRIEELPGRLAVVGGGYVGCEFAHVFSALGSEVTQIHTGHRLLHHQDDDVAEVFTRDVAWRTHLAVQLERVTRTEGCLVLNLADDTVVQVDAVLVATGRRPNSDLLDLEKAGVETHDDGRVVVDEYQRTTAEGVWALGDASSDYALKHVANHEAKVVRHNLLHPDDLRASDHRFVPSAVFTNPQIAAVGLTERDARERGLDVAVISRGYAGTAFGWALNHDDAGWFCKLVADRATGRLVGAHLLGPQASALIQPLVQAMSFEQPVAGLARGQYWIHPAPTEVVENALLDLERELAT